jgi:hypothetical protein
MHRDGHNGSRVTVYGSVAGSVDAASQANDYIRSWSLLVTFNVVFGSVALTDGEAEMTASVFSRHSRWHASMAAIGSNCGYWRVLTGTGGQVSIGRSGGFDRNMHIATKNGSPKRAAGKNSSRKRCTEFLGF